MRFISAWINLFKFMIQEQCPPSRFSWSLLGLLFVSQQSNEPGCSSRLCSGCLINSQTDMVLLHITCPTKLPDPTETAWWELQHLRSKEPINAYYMRQVFDFGKVVKSETQRSSQPWIKLLIKKRQTQMNCNSFTVNLDHQTPFNIRQKYRFSIMISFIKGRKRSESPGFIWKTTFKYLN